MAMGGGGRRREVDYTLARCRPLRCCFCTVGHASAEVRRWAERSVFERTTDEDRTEVLAVRWAGSCEMCHFNHHACSVCVCVFYWLLVVLVFCRAGKVVCNGGVFVFLQNISRQLVCSLLSV